MCTCSLSRQYSLAGRALDLESGNLTSFQILPYPRSKPLTVVNTPDWDQTSKELKPSCKHLRQGSGVFKILRTKGLPYKPALKSGYLMFMLDYSLLCIKYMGFSHFFWNYASVYTNMHWYAQSRIFIRPAKSS